ncbi:hypothetical protein C8Q80DRAFT_554687 [Daedaleopsis nitida]|nr:hypothetical protein C8Q80DRAFT_554687 [Daedaleopsis nitida]
MSIQYPPPPSLNDEQAAMCNINQLPTEIWRTIVTLACTDGGFTGRSLALASRFLHRQSLSARFHSVALTSLARAEGLLELLDCQPPECQPRIEHLYLSFGVDAIASFRPLPWMQSSVLARIERDDWEARYLSAMPRLFALVAPTLRTLCICEHNQTPLPPVYSQEFPMLEELSVVHRADVPLPDTMPSLPPSINTSQAKTEDSARLSNLMGLFPVLRRLHCIHSSSWPLPTVVANLPLVAPPTLTHVRMSGVTSLNRNYNELPGVLAKVLRVERPELERGTRNRPPERPSRARDPGPDEGSAPGTDPSESVSAQGDEAASHLCQERDMPNALANLQVLIVHGYGPAVQTASMAGGVATCETSRDLSWDKCIADLEDVADRCEASGRGVQIALLRRPWRRNPHWPERLRDDWKNRIEGGKGCWILSEEEEAALEVSEDDPYPALGHFMFGVPIPHQYAHC